MNKNKQVNLLTIKGYIPLYYAGWWYYTKVLIPILEQASSMLKSEKMSICVNFPDLKTKHKFICDDGTIKIYKSDQLYYAPISKYNNKSKHPKIRDFECWTRMNTLSPFRSAQMYMKQKGFYLVELGNDDSERIVMLYNYIPPYNEKKNYGIIIIKYMIFIILLIIILLI